MSASPTSPTASPAKAVALSGLQALCPPGAELVGLTATNTRKAVAQMRSQVEAMPQDARTAATLSILKKVEDGVSNERGILAYRHDGQVQGLIVLDRAGSAQAAQVQGQGKSSAFVEVYDIVTLPGTKGIGGRLMEAAVNATGAPLRLTPKNEAAAAAFSALGFQGDAVGMKLQPADSASWCVQDGLSRLRKNVEG